MNFEADVEKFNALLDALTDKLFAHPAIFARTVRAACAIHGINLPTLPVELIDDDSQSKEAEYVFKMEDPEGNIHDHYLFFIVDEIKGCFYHCYAQIVTDDELQDIIVMKEPPATPELEHDYLKLTRHARDANISTNQEMDDGPPVN